MTTSETGLFVLVIGRAVYRSVPVHAIDAVRDAVVAGHETVTFTVREQVVEARISGVDVGWAAERHPMPVTSKVRGRVESDRLSRVDGSFQTDPRDAS